MQTTSNQPAKKGVLLVNLGSPDSPSVPDVRRHLREFLMDPRVLDINWLGRFCLVHFIILPFRPQKSSLAYQAIWTPEGSPLVVISRKLRDQLQAIVSLPVGLAMRYQNPSIEKALRDLAGQGVLELLLIPMFPHYAMSSYETAVERVREVAGRIAPEMAVRVHPPYFDHPLYIDALAASASACLAKPYDHLLFSFHGIPERHIRKTEAGRVLSPKAPSPGMSPSPKAPLSGRVLSPKAPPPCAASTLLRPVPPASPHCLVTPNCCDTPSPAHEFCYRAQCFKTAKAFVARAGVPQGKWSVAFQSRLGRDRWLSPYTDKRIVELANSGVKRLIVICPAFVSDCLETLEEIGMRGCESFLRSGGESCELIPCLNTHPAWVRALAGMVEKFATEKTD